MKAVIKKLLGPTATSTMKAAKAALSSLITQGLCVNAWVCSLWYGGLKNQFSREIIAVKRGGLRHQILSESKSQNHPRLRRNVHRLEKGLLMRPRKATFAQSYIKVLVNDYTSQVRNPRACGEELQWAYNVLSEYFSVVSDIGVIGQARKEFESCQHKFDSLKSYKPFPREESPTDISSWDQFYNLCTRRRSVRWYQDRKVPRKFVEQAITAATLAPSACNRQPFDIYIIDGDSLKTAVNLPMGTAGWAENIPMLLVFVGDLSSFEHHRDRHVPYIDASLAAMTLMLALETLGLSSCPINWPDIEPREKAMSQLLELADWQRPIMCLSVGYAEDSGAVAYSQKRSPSQLIKYRDAEEADV